MRYTVASKLCFNLGLISSMANILLNSFWKALANQTQSIGNQNVPPTVLAEQPLPWLIAPGFTSSLTCLNSFVMSVFHLQTFCIRFLCNSLLPLYHFSMAPSIPAPLHQPQPFSPRPCMLMPMPLTPRPRGPVQWWPNYCPYFTSPHQNDRQSTFSPWRCRQHLHPLQLDY